MNKTAIKITLIVVVAGLIAFCMNLFTSYNEDYIWREKNCMFIPSEVEMEDNHFTEEGHQ